MRNGLWRNQKSIIRIRDDAVIQLFYSTQVPIPEFACPDSLLHEATITLIDHGAPEHASMSVKVILEKKRIYSLESPPLPPHYAAHHGMDLGRLTVSRVQHLVDLESGLYVHKKIPNILNDKMH